MGVLYSRLLMILSFQILSIPAVLAFPAPSNRAFSCLGCSMMIRKRAAYSQCWQGLSSNLIANTKPESMQTTWCSACMWCCACSSVLGEKVTTPTLL